MVTGDKVKGERECAEQGELAGDQDAGPHSELNRKATAGFSAEQ